MLKRIKSYWPSHPRWPSHWRLRRTARDGMRNDEDNESSGDTNTEHNNTIKDNGGENL